jgi:hypothetical protein
VTVDPVLPCIASRNRLRTLHKSVSYSAKTRPWLKTALGFLSNFETIDLVRDYDVADPNILESTCDAHHQNDMGIEGLNPPLDLHCGSNVALACLDDRDPPPGRAALKCTDLIDGFRRMNLLAHINEMFSDRREFLRERSNDKRSSSGLVRQRPHL